MLRVCIHIGVRKHLMQIGTCQTSFDIAYHCIANEVRKTSTINNFAIVVATSKQFLVEYLFTSPSNGERHHLANLTLEVVVNKFSIFSSPNCCNFILDLKHFVRSGMDTMDNIMVLKYHSGFKYVHGSKCPRHSKNKVYIFKMLVDLSESGVDFVKRMQVGGDMANSWIIFDYVKRLKGWTTLAYHTSTIRY